jgi:hypothetical protein
VDYSKSINIHIYSTILHPTLQSVMRFSNPTIRIVALLSSASFVPSSAAAAAAVVEKEEDPGKPEVADIIKGMPTKGPSMDVIDE